MADRKIKRQHHPATIFSIFPLLLYPFVPLFSPMDCFSVFSAFSVAVSFVPSCLSGQDPRSTLVEKPLQIRLFMQNKPNPPAPGITTTSFAPKIYTNFPPNSTPKNKPKTNPIHPTQTPGQIEAEPISRCTSGPNSPPAICNTQSRRAGTQYEIRDPTYDIRHTPYEPYPPAQRSPRLLITCTKPPCL